ncbi:MarR family winged helix-turn-helix transcriptional regulator [Frigoribacterium sp. 2-23]|uniref:MarR family winged helix-turn-helix transcriptional regulator n=1 Tax=Frigoribacterium sp. 2-23 TaxID=3415006 RepID=UPI003C6F9A98
MPPTTPTEPALPTTGLAPSELRYLVLASQREGNRALNRQLSSYGLTASQFEILLVLDEYGPLTLKELGELIVCETSSPSRIIDTLVRRELVARGTDSQDRRALSLDLAPQGQSLIPELRLIDERIDGMARETLNDDDVRGLVAALRAYLAGTESGGVLDRRFRQRRRSLEE